MTIYTAKLKAAAEKAKDNFHPSFMVSTRDVLDLIAALEASQKRNAELGASHEKLRDALAAIHNTIRLDGLNAPLAAIMSSAKRAHEESAAAAGINLRRGESDHG
ncbi:hypothetical protein ACYAO4_004001 [Cronobacter turicensis]